jgi:hypothetical protein
VWVAAPIAYAVGVACAGCDDSRAADFFTQAVQIAARINAPVLIARAGESIPALALH